VRQAGTTKLDGDKGWIKVLWDGSGDCFTYRVREGAYDLAYADAAVPTAVAIGPMAVGDRVRGRKGIERCGVPDRCVGKLGRIESGDPSSFEVRFDGEGSTWHTSDDYLEKVSASATATAAATATPPSGGGGAAKTMKATIGDAIEIGAPAYNEGDHARCYREYQRTAEGVLCRVTSSAVQTVVRKALAKAAEEASKTTAASGRPGPTEAAWTMRHCFDSLSGGAADPPLKVDAPVLPFPSSTKDAIRKAIRKGAPTYNEGDHLGCFHLYRRTAELIVGCVKPDNNDGKAVLERFRTALRKAGAEAERGGGDGVTQAVWTMRRAFDETVEAAIGDAIEIGAPAYNEGGHAGCYRG